MNEISSETFDLDKFQKEVLWGIDSIEDDYYTSEIYQMREVRRSPRIEIASDIDLSGMKQRQKILEEIRKEISGKIIIFNTGNIESLLKELEASEEALYQSIQRQLQLIQKRIEEEMGEAYYGLSSSFGAIEKSIQRKKEQEEQRVLATKILITEKILTRICPALQSISNASHDIAKIIVPILIPLVLAGTLTIPLQPLIFSYIAILISRMGVASLCADYSKNKSKES